MAVVRKKQDDKNLKVLREIVTSGGGNRQCFDCGQKGPTYVNMTIGSVVCTRCSGVLRGLTPPHRVKSISMATFTQEEIDFLKSNGNDACAKTWLGLWDPKRIIHQDQRELMIDKYERKRYYLEPASPLKSLTNATKVTAMNGSNHINNNTSNHNNNTNINNNINNISNKNNNSSLDNNLKNISLTPPNSLRLSNNSNGSMNGGNTTISGNRQQNRYNFQNQFTPEENNFFDTNHQQQQQHHNNSNQDKRNSSTANGFLMNGSSNYNRQIVNNNKNSLNISTNNETNRNKFTPDSDFVADFGNAKIFNATTPAITIPPPMNGYKTKQHYQQNGVAKNMNNQNNTQITNFMNNANNGIMPSSGSMSSGSSSSATTVTSSSNNDQSNASENFADFDHAPIYNAAASYPKSNTNNFNNFAYSSAASNSSYMNNNNINYNNQNNNNNHNNQTVQSFNYSNQNHSNPMQWNLWQQFNWPSSPTGSNDHNRWSLPVSLNSTSSLSSSATFNSNSSFNSTPPADRYAALKDLDEQLREHKVTAVDSFSTSVAPSTGTSNVNPFKMQPANQTQQQHQHQQQQISNPFQGNFGQQPTTNGFFQSQTGQSLTSSSNIFGSNSAINSQMMVGSNFSNGYPTAMNGTAPNGNSCGFGFGGSISTQKNPFATTSHNSNNPFL